MAQMARKQRGGCSIGDYTILPAACCAERRTSEGQGELPVVAFNPQQQPSALLHAAAAHAARRLGSVGVPPAERDGVRLLSCDEPGPRTRSRLPAAREPVHVITWGLQVPPKLRVIASR